ncbi:BlaI/MecI/CopY family transcriptional regulator [Streptomyces sp. NPDC051018]|uniref:BlaI/MecI/CopY family transcriptional regulator n=1 Tax=Streptomyces sp. NPDC051018 TaxID=3365639 RepID=UPI00379FF31A
MTRVWQWNRPVTVREVLEDLQQDRSIAYTTVMTVMDNLHQKGWVRREVEGRAYRYTAVSTRAAYSAALMNEAWSKSDNPAAALVAFFGMMSPEQREALQAAVRIVQADIPQSDPVEGDNAREDTVHGDPGGDAGSEDGDDGSEGEREEGSEGESLTEREAAPRAGHAVQAGVRHDEAADGPPTTGR